MKIVLKEDMMAGEPIQKKQIASHYLQRYEVYNLYRYRHPEGYRSCYTLHKFKELGVCPVILDIMPHPEYERRFGYR